MMRIVLRYRKNSVEMIPQAVLMVQVDPSSQDSLRPYKLTI